MNRITLVSFGLSSIIPLILLVTATESFAQGNLIIMPRRVVFDASKRTQELSLANTGSDTAKYLISVIQYRMKDNGSFELITEPDSGQYFADKNFRFFPRSVILAPNEAQTLKVQAINTSELKSGEYRSHLYFRSVSNEKSIGQRLSDSTKKEISVRLVPVFGIAIPVIIRSGPPVSIVVITKAALEINAVGTKQLKMTFNREGNVSVYGDIKVLYVSTQGKTIDVGLAKGFAIYTPNKQRHVTIALKNEGSEIDYHKGKLHILFTTSSDTKAAKIAETELVLF